MDDHRKYSRIPSRLRCWCEGDNVTVYARIGNLSEGGLFLRTSTPLERGSVATVRLDGDEPIEAPALVVWSRVEGQEGPAGMGLEFQGPDKTRTEKIRRLMESELRHGTAHGR